MMHTLFAWGGFELHAAPVMAGFSVLAAFLYFRARGPAAGLSEEDLWTLLAAMALGVMGGAVLFFALTYTGGPAAVMKSLFVKRKITGGSFLGSFWLTIALVWLYCRSRKLAAAPVYDIVALSSMLALSIMRLGCLMNGCCHGVPAQVPWGLVFSDPGCSVPARLLGLPLHPTQLYEAAGSLLIFLAGHFAILRRGRSAPGAAFVFCVVCYAALRFAVDFVRAGIPGRLDAFGLTTAQMISAVSAAGTILWYRYKRKT